MWGCLSTSRILHDRPTIMVLYNIQTKGALEASGTSDTQCAVHEGHTLLSSRMSNANASAGGIFSFSNLFHSSTASGLVIFQHSLVLNPGRTTSHFLGYVSPPGISGTHD
jgi:hypothetical protein